MIEETVMKTKNELVISKESLLYMKMLASRAGIDLNDYKLNAIYHRIEKRLRVLDIPDIDTYCYRLRIDLEEEIKFINIVTNPTTFFFRENHHFEYFKNHLLPELIAKKKRIRIWSAGCSSGEEAYSIAIVVREVAPNLQNYDIKILATDINSDALQTAEKGIYHDSRLKKMDPTRQKLWFNQVTDQDSNLVMVSPNIKELITFRQLNLMSNWPVHGPFDVIFCRNVIIYFKQDINRRILQKFDNLLEINGALILGHSENVDELRDRYVAVERTLYKKIV